MNKREFIDHKGNKWIRVSKLTAQKLFNAGDRVAMAPVNVNPAGPLGYYEATHNEDRDFGIQAVYCEAYNCNSETGRYLAYYVTYGPAISIRAPRFSSGGLGYVTADTIEVYVNGYRLKNHEWMEELGKLATSINRGDGSARTIHDILDPVAQALVGRVAW